MDALMVAFESEWYEDPAPTIPKASRCVIVSSRVITICSSYRRHSDRGLGSGAVIVFALCFDVNQQLSTPPYPPPTTRNPSAMTKKDAETLKHAFNMLHA